MLFLITNEANEFHYKNSKLSLKTEGVRGDHNHKEMDDRQDGICEES